jgi:hypothetical protein
MSRGDEMRDRMRSLAVFDGELPPLIGGAGAWVRIASVW